MTEATETTALCFPLLAIGVTTIETRQLDILQIKCLDAHSTCAFVLRRTELLKQMMNKTDIQ